MRSFSSEGSFGRQYIQCSQCDLSNSIINNVSGYIFCVKFTFWGSQHVQKRVLHCRRCFLGVALRLSVVTSHVAMQTNVKIRKSPKIPKPVHLARSHIAHAVHLTTDHPHAESGDDPSGSFGGETSNYAQTFTEIICRISMIEKGNCRLDIYVRCAQGSFLPKSPGAPTLGAWGGGGPQGLHPPARVLTHHRAQV